MVEEIGSGDRDVVLWGWETFFSELVRFIETSERQLKSHASRGYSEYVLDRLELITHKIVDIRDYLHQQQTSPEQLSTVIHSLGGLLDLMPQLSSKWQQHLDDIERHASLSSYRAPLEHSAGFGRPRIFITQEQLEYLRSLSFSWTSIGKMLGVSRMTLYRRRSEYGMLTESPGSISDSQLMTVVRHLRSELPDVGQAMLIGRLRAMGFHVQRERVREAIRKSDPFNTALRWHNLTSRRPYSVLGPNSSWHIGTVHKIVGG